MKKPPVDWHRYNFEGQGRTFLLLMGGLYVVAFAVYLGAHWLYPASLTVKNPEELVRIDGFGRTSLISAEEVEWNIGAEKAVPLLTQMEHRSQQIQSELSTLQGNLIPFRERFDLLLDRGASAISDPINRGNFRQAWKMIERFRETLAPATIGAEGSRQIGLIESALSKLEHLRGEQRTALSNLRTPDRYQVFWLTPNLLLVEVAVWSLFGVMTSLLFHSGEFQRRKEFVPAERWVAFTKLLYTPAITVVLVLAIWAGIIHIGGPESRIWLTPLLSFLAGFNARKAADLVDAISQWALAHAMQSLRRTDAEREATREQQIAPISKAMPAKYQNLEDFRSEAKLQAKDELMREILRREANA